MSTNTSTRTTWMEDPSQIIMLTNKSKQNFILELPSGRYRLDAGRRMRTLRSILRIGQVERLVNEGLLSVEK
jgi:hypothetical protein